ncbi:hypothetical protein PILCRDRAFT_91013 [Piloderma croceum F 1598]|uniref:Uncharacterized protein n=1 Tax=Piloderma croceum (strain F 1598) TaxID=765440 RepID=A0A0C3FD00_PILCF|nr:hypothetical protein PILCRDRAFT_91013 [Piloderma croceum F 1598]
MASRAIEAAEFWNDKVPVDDGDESIMHLLVCFFTSGDIVKMGKRLDLNEKHRAFPFVNNDPCTEEQFENALHEERCRSRLKTQESVVWAVVFGFISHKAVNEVELFSNGISPSHNWVDLEYDLHI